MLNRLNGIFAFAIHDARTHGRPAGVERGALFLARDQIGVKPLYFSTTPQGFLFASEIKALLCHPAIARESIRSPCTKCSRTCGRRRHAPCSAQCASWSRGVRCWSIGAPWCGTGATIACPMTASATPARARRSQQNSARVLEQAVRRQLVADVPVGAFLSGGLDSSAVVAMMRRAQPEQRIQCFSIGFADDVDSEGNPADLPYARRVAKHLNVDLEEIRIDATAHRPARGDGRPAR